MTSSASRRDAVGDEAVRAIAAAYPRVTIDPDRLFFYAGLLERKVMLMRCGTCANWSVQPHRLCPKCWSDAVEPAPIAGQGSVYMWTLIRQRPSFWPSGPNDSSVLTQVTVELIEQKGLRLTGEMPDGDFAGIKMGAAVKLAWEDREGAPYPIFKLAVAQ